MQAQLSRQHAEEQRHDDLVVWLCEQLAEHAPTVFRQRVLPSVVGSHTRRSGLGALSVGTCVGRPRDSGAQRHSEILTADGQHNVGSSRVVPLGPEARRASASAARRTSGGSLVELLQQRRASAPALDPMRSSLCSN